MWFKTAAEWADRVAEYHAIAEKWLRSGLIKGVLRGYAELLARSRIVTMNFMGLSDGYVATPAVLDATEILASAIKRIALQGELQFYTEAPLSQLALPAILLYHVK
jgi:hypothetical protein